VTPDTPVAGTASLSAEDGERALHLVAGLAYGREATCGVKIDYENPETAHRAAAQVSAKNERLRPGARVLEAYPCPWCLGWHIGRALTRDERKYWGGVAETFLIPR
jgi:hypothetical protein